MVWISKSPRIHVLMAWSPAVGWLGGGGGCQKEITSSGDIGNPAPSSLLASQPPWGKKLTLPCGPWHEVPPHLRPKATRPRDGNLCNHQSFFLSYPLFISGISATVTESWLTHGYFCLLNSRHFLTQNLNFLMATPQLSLLVSHGSVPCVKIPIIGDPLWHKNLTRAWQFWESLCADHVLYLYKQDRPCKKPHTRHATESSAGVVLFKVMCWRNMQATLWCPQWGGRGSKQFIKRLINRPIRVLGSSNTQLAWIRIKHSSHIQINK
jgi:hypothetical protein